MSRHISIVMVVHNRFHSVHMALHAWSLQTEKDFSLVLADDGSTQDIFSLIKMYKGKLRLQYYRQNEAEHGNVAVALNKGTVLVPSETTHIWYTDGDIIFGGEAIESAYGHIGEYPDRVITGRYDWMPPMNITPDTLEHDFQKFVNCELVSSEMGAPPSEMVRRQDHRVLKYGPDFFKHRLSEGCGAILGANVIIPAQAWKEVRGWDEHIPGANANDCDFGWCLTDAGYRLLTCDCIIGYHQWHLRNPEILGLYKVSLPYIFRKHGKEVPDFYKPYDTYVEGENA